MILIIASHYVYHGGSMGIGPTLNGNIAHFIFVGGKTGVIMFVLISGYFLCESRFKIEKIIYIAAERLFYSSLIFLACILFLNYKASKWDWFVYFIPALYSNYWFVGPYLVMYILSPLLNCLNEKLNKEQSLLLLGVLFVMLTGVSFLPQSHPFGTSEVFYFLFLYLIASYIRKYVELKKIKNWILLLAGLISWGIVFGTYLLINRYYNYISFAFDDNVYYSALTSPFILIIAISFFLIFKQLKIKTSVAINLIASTTFGIYLIHDHGVLRPYLWNYLKVSLYFNSPWYLLNFLVSVCLIFAAGFIIDLIRQLFFDLIFRTRFYLNFVKKVDDKICKTLYPEEKTAERKAT
jgi:surface polysaccharide O-acyltransferase-like enzyme